MQLTNILLLFSAAAATVMANPLEARNSWKDAKKCNNWPCQKVYPNCDDDWYPKYCKNGWGDKNCGDYCKWFPFSWTGKRLTACSKMTAVIRARLTAATRASASGTNVTIASNRLLGAGTTWHVRCS
jgi:hypothetical protein